MLITYVVVGYIHRLPDIGVALRQHFLDNQDKYGVHVPHVLEFQPWVFRADVAREIVELSKRLEQMQASAGRHRGIIVPTANPWVVETALSDVHIRGTRQVSEFDFYKITQELWGRILAVKEDGSIERMSESQRRLFDYFLNLGTTISPGTASKTPGFYIADILQNVGFWPTQESWPPREKT